MSHHQPALVPRPSHAWPGACAVHPRHIQIGVPLHSTGQGRPENGTPWLAGARAAKEVAARFNFFQIRDSAISNPRIWIVSERPALSIKGPGKAAIQLFKIERGKLPNLLLQNCFWQIPRQLWSESHFKGLGFALTSHCEILWSFSSEDSQCEYSLVSCTTLLVSSIQSPASRFHQLLVFFSFVGPYNTSGSHWAQPYITFPWANYGIGLILVRQLRFDQVFRSVANFSPYSKMKSISFNGAPEVKYSRVSPGEVNGFEKFIKELYKLQKIIFQNQVLM